MTKKSADALLNFETETPEEKKPTHARKLGGKNLTSLLFFFPLALLAVTALVAGVLALGESQDLFSFAKRERKISGGGPESSVSFSVPCLLMTEESNLIVEDLDLDGDGEIIFSCGNTLYVFDHQGNQIFTKQSIVALPAAGELDLDSPGKEIVVLQDFSSTASTNTWELMAWRSDGTPVPGNWPRTITFPRSLVRQPVERIMIEDINNDGQNDIVVIEGDEDRLGPGRFQGVRVLALSADGSDLPGFNPYNGPWFNTSYTGEFENEHFVVDVTGDLGKEIIIRELFDLSVSDKAGNLLWKLEDVGMGPVAVGDFDQDGDSEIIVTLNHGDLYKYDWNGTTFVSELMYQLPSATQSYRIGQIQPVEVNGDQIPEFLLEIHYSFGVQTYEGFYKFVVVEANGTLVTGFPGSPDAQFPSLPVNPAGPWGDYPVKWDSYDVNQPIQVTYGKSGDETIFAYEAMVFRNTPNNSTYKPNTFLELYGYKYDDSPYKLTGFPVEIFNLWNNCTWTCETIFVSPVIFDVDEDGLLEVVSAVDDASANRTQMIVTIHNTSLSSFAPEWQHYLQSTERTQAYEQIFAPPPSPIPSPSPTSTPQPQEVDLTIQPGSYSVSGSYGNGNITVDATLINQGNTNSGPFTVRFYTNRWGNLSVLHLIDEVDVVTVGSNQAVIINETFNTNGFLEADNIWLFIDEDNLIIESDETNNQFSEPIPSESPVKLRL